MSFVPLVRLWIWISVFASAAGWTLSAFGQLNRTGYGICFIAFVIFLIAGRKQLDLFPAAKSFCLKKFLRRFRRPLPLCFAALAVLIFLGGAIYPPSNYTGLNYREARVLQWLAYGHWLWIHTPNFRMNDRACGFEWLTAPLMLFLKSDRALFLLNFIPFLLLPGLVFSIFTRLGVRARVACNGCGCCRRATIFCCRPAASPTTRSRRSMRWRRLTLPRAHGVRGGRQICGIQSSPPRCWLVPRRATCRCCFRGRS